MPRLFVILALLLSLGGCVDEATVRTEVEFGKRLVADLQARKFDAIEALVDKASVEGGIRATLAKWAERLPKDAPTAIDTVGLNVKTVVTGKETWRVTALSLQYQFGDKWLVFNARWRKADTGPALVELLQIVPLEASLRELNGFVLAGKTPAHYTALGLVVALPIFTLLVLISCLRTPMQLWRKALWAVFIVVGISALSLNWTTGALFWQPVAFLVGGAYFAKTEFGPAVLSIAFPLGAILFLFRRGALRRRFVRESMRHATHF